MSSDTPYNVQTAVHDLFLSFEIDLHFDRYDYVRMIMQSLSIQYNK